MHQVRYFLALCAEQNFTRAARRCGVKQPSLTRAVKKMEMELGGPLFDRDRTNTRLTDLGIYVRHEIERIDRSSMEVKRKAAQFLATPTTKSRPRIMEVFMRAHHVIVVVAVLVIVVGAKLFLFPPKKAEADTRTSASLNVHQMHRNINMQNLPVQNMHDMTFVFDSD